MPVAARPMVVSRVAVPGPIWITPEPRTRSRSKPSVPPTLDDRMVLPDADGWAAMVPFATALPDSVVVPVTPSVPLTVVLPVNVEVPVTDRFPPTVNAPSVVSVAAADRYRSVSVAVDPPGPH